MRFAAGWGFHSEQKRRRLLDEERRTLLLSQSQPFPFLRLPAELQDMIADLCDHPSLISLSSTCRMLRVHLLPQAFRSFRFNNDPDVANAQLEFISCNAVRGAARNLSLVPLPLFVRNIASNDIASASTVEAPSNSLTADSNHSNRQVTLIRTRHAQMYDRRTRKLVLLDCDQMQREWQIAFPPATRVLLSGHGLPDSCVFDSLVFREDDDDFCSAITTRDFDIFIGAVWQALRINTRIRHFEFTGTDLYLHMQYCQHPAPFLQTIREFTWNGPATLTAARRHTPWTKNGCSTKGELDSQLTEAERKLSTSKFSGKTCNRERRHRLSMAENTMRHRFYSSRQLEAL